MVASRLLLSVTVCLIYVPHITASFLRKSVSPKRSERSAGVQLSIRPQNISLFFNEGLPPETVAIENSSIVLECQATGRPPPTIHWLKDGVRVVQASGDEASYEDLASVQDGRALGLSSTKSRLYLDCLNGDHEGEYTCVAEHALLSKSQSTLLRVERPPADVLFSEIQVCNAIRSDGGKPARIYMWTVSRLELEHSLVQLFCRAEGNPTPTITYFDINDMVIENDENYEVSENSDLIIRNITWLENKGEYDCFVDNPFGVDVAALFLYPTRRE